MFFQPESLIYTHFTIARFPGTVEFIAAELLIKC